MRFKSGGNMDGDKPVVHVIDKPKKKSKGFA